MFRLKARIVQIKRRNIALIEDDAAKVYSENANIVQVHSENHPI